MSTSSDRSSKDDGDPGGDRDDRPGGVVVGVDVGGTKTALLAVDLVSGEDLARDRFSTPTDAGPEAMIAGLCEAVPHLLGKANRARDELRAIGLAVPGLVDVEQGRVIVAGNLQGWTDVPLRDIVCRELGVPTFVDQDANAAALGERWRGGAKELHNFVFLALGTGVGAGLVINGRIHRGFHHAAGEVGNFVMGREFLGQERGRHGNLELLVGSPAIKEETRRTAGEELPAAEAIERAEEDARLEPVVDDVADYVAMVVINIAALLDPEAIILGGGTASAGDDLLEPVRERVEREMAIRPTLMRSVLGEEAQLHGAVFGALWELDPDLALREELR